MSQSLLPCRKTLEQLPNHRWITLLESMGSVASGRAGIDVGVILRREIGCGFDYAVGRSVMVDRFLAIPQRSFRSFMLLISGVVFDYMDSSVQEMIMRRCNVHVRGVTAIGIRVNGDIGALVVPVSSLLPIHTTSVAANLH